MRAARPRRRWPRLRGSVQIFAVQQRNSGRRGLFSRWEEWFARAHARLLRRRAELAAQIRRTHPVASGIHSRARRCRRRKGRAAEKRSDATNFSPGLRVSFECALGAYRRSRGFVARHGSFFVRQRYAFCAPQRHAVPHLRGSVVLPLRDPAFTGSANLWRAAGAEEAGATALGGACRENAEKVALHRLSML